MSDNVPLPAAAGNAATDDVTYSGDSAQVQLVRLVGVAGAEGSKTVVPFRYPQKLSVTSSGLTTVTTTYAAGDQVGALMTLSNAAAVSGGSGVITGVTLIDASDVLGAVDLVIYDSSVTLGSDNAAVSISDADALKIVAVVQLTGAYDIGENRVSQAQNLAVPYVCNGSADLYASIIARSSISPFAAGATSLTLNVYVEQSGP